MSSYESTNRSSELVNFREALLKGQAPDRGLYTPVEIPKFEDGDLSSFSKMSYPEIAYAILSKYIDDEVSPSALRKITSDAYDFDVPLEHVKDRLYVMRLDRGPTASFKDFAARCMARLMSHFLGDSGNELMILTATSGDTGSAVANAFHGIKNIRVVVLFPENEVTERQRKQMTTLSGNVTSVAVEGKFDDCQALVKQAFSDDDLRGLHLSSANSINIGRLIPQSVYYVYSYVKLCVEVREDVVFSVPSGNFGDLMGGLLAKNMGLPVSKYVVATNEN
ncbi:MAG: threonine synthase, partial [Candidatus Altiarchaeota archaeon]|nr:threonine synthase [Candidatus Altiarchaeota archaeon]